MDVFSAYKPLRNKIAKLGLEESLRAIWGYSQFLQIEQFSFPSDIEVDRKFVEAKIPQALVSEWELELLAKEVILNSGPLTDKSFSLKRWKIFSEILNGVKSLEGQIYKSFGSTDNVLIEMIRIAHRQFQWRADPPNAATTIRYYLIFNRPDIDEICISKLNLSVRDIYLCGMASMGSFLSHAATKYPMTSEIPTVTQEKVDRFLLFASRSVSDLRKLLKVEQRFDANFAYAFNSLRTYPLVLTSAIDGVLLCPIPTLLFWRITKGLYYELVAESAFANAFGASFQRYVGDSIDRACIERKVQKLAEAEYGPKALNKRSVDWIVYDDSGALFVECKARRLSWDAKSALIDLAPLNKDVDGLASSVVQVYKTARDYLDGQYPHFPFRTERKIYPVVVTLENWHVFGPVMMKMLDEAIVRQLSEENIPADITKKMPYSIWSIGDLEEGFQLLEANSIVSFMDGKLDDPEMKQWEWRPYIGKQFPKARMKALFSAEYDDMFSEIRGLSSA
jgi:hypothetical protein